MKLFSMSCTIYSDVMVAGARYRIHLYTNWLYSLPRCIIVAQISFKYISSSIAKIEITI